MNSYRPLEGRPAYAASKAAVNNFTQWLAAHLAKEYSPALRVNAIAPGFFPNERMRSTLFDKSGQLTERTRRIIAHTPMGRLGEVEDLVGTAIWYAADASRFVTGTITAVDGGFNTYAGV
jgi:NAD(P)-dependent dehydrogenase (short-subunit alcohol dehydrogenase family)